MAKSTTIPVECPHCGAPLEFEYKKGMDLFFECGECGGAFNVSRRTCEEYVNNREHLQFEQALADYRFRKQHGIPSNWNRRTSSGSSSRNGFSDPDDFPSDGYGDSGW